MGTPETVGNTDLGSCPWLKISSYREAGPEVRCYGGSVSWPLDRRSAKPRPDPALTRLVAS